MGYIQSIKPTGMLLAQPYPITDFSGGITDNFIQAVANRYMKADNFIVTVDRKLECRYGSQILPSPNYILPSGNARVGALINYDQEAAIFAQCGPYMYALGSVWSPLVGPLGQPALGPGDFTQQVSYGMFQHQLYITNDSANGLITKIYLDSNGVFQVRTAGLPVMPTLSNYDPTLLTQTCINLANNLLTVFLAHVNDQGSIGTNLHAVIDTVTKAVLTAASAATNLSTLLTLCASLAKAFGTHIGDAQLAGPFRAYHFNTYAIFVGGAFESLADTRIVGNISTLNLPLETANPIDQFTAATFLDDLLTKYKYHVYAPFTHDYNNSNALIGVHLPTAGHVNYTTGPVVTPNLTPILSSVAQFMTQFNAHILDTNYHVQADTTNTIGVPAPTDMDSLVIAIAHCLGQYNSHQIDSSWPFAYGHATFSSGTSGATAAAIDTQPATVGVTNSFGVPVTNLTFFPGAYTVVSSGPTPFASHFTTISATGTGTTFSFGAPGSTTANANGTMASNTLSFSFSSFHRQTEPNIQAAQYVQGNLGVNGVDLASWTDIFQTLTALFNSHDGSQTHWFPVFPSTSTQTGPELTLYLMTTPVPEIAEYVYAFHLLDSYVASGITYDIVGPPIFVGPIQTPTIANTLQAQQETANSFNVVTIPVSPITITNIPSLSEGASDKYDLSNLQVAIFRTTDSGPTYYNITPLSDGELGGIPNGQSSFTDSFGDTLPTSPGAFILNEQVVLYTSGGVVNFDPAPMSKYMHILNGTAYYGGIWDTGQFFPNRIRQSIQDVPDSSPGSFFVDLDDIVTGISSSKSNLLGFCQNSSYRITGQFNELGQGEMVAERISDSIGCISNASIVQTEMGVFFAGNDGFYFTDGYQLLKLSSELNVSYQALIQTAQQRRNLYGAYDKWNKRIWWSVQPNPGDWDVSKSWVLHLDFGVSAQAVFTTSSNFDSYRPSSMLFFQNTQYRGDARGYIFTHSSLFKSDPLVNVNTTPTSWAQVYMPWAYASCAFDFGSTFNRKWVPRITVTGKNQGNFALQIQSINDNGKSDAYLAPLLYKSNSVWGNPGDVWGSPGEVWMSTKQADMWRRFPAGQMRCDFKQIIFTPAKVGIYRYEDWPVGAWATTVGGSPTGACTLSSPSGYTLIWPTDISTSYVIAFQVDGYVTEYPITAVSGATLTLSAPSGNLPTLAHQSWVIRGIPVNAKVSLTAINLHYSLLGKSQDSYQGAQSSGENT